MRDGVRKVVRRNTNRCEHELQQLLDGTCEHVKPDGALLVHSHYDLDRTEFVDLVHAVALVAIVCHVFDGMSGTTHGEGTWQRTKRDGVIHKVGGNTYVHKSCGDWLLDGSLPSTVSVSEHTRFGDTWVFLATKAKPRPNGEDQRPITVDEPKVVAPPQDEEDDTIVIYDRRGLGLFWPRKQVVKTKVARKVWEAIPVAGTMPAGIELQSAGRAICRSSVDLTAKEYLKHRWLTRAIIDAADDKYPEYVRWSAMTLTAAVALIVVLMVHLPDYVPWYLWALTVPFEMVYHWKKTLIPTFAAVSAIYVWTRNPGSQQPGDPVYSRCMGISRNPVRAAAKIFPGADRCGVKPVATLVGPVIEGPIWFPAMCTCNFEMALRERGLMPVSGPKAAFYEAFVDFTKQHVDVGKVAPAEWEDYLAGLPARRRKLLEGARFSQGTHRPKLIVKAFVKFEPYHDDKAPRLISGTSPAFQAVTGPAIKTLAAAVARHLANDVRGVFRYAYGMTAAQVGEWLARSVDECEMGAPGTYRALACGDDNLVVVNTAEGVRVFELDGNRFDARFPVEANAALVRWYSVVVDDEHANEGLATLEHPYKGYAKADWSFENHGTMQSGRADTSLGDSLVTMYIVWKALDGGHGAAHPTQVANLLNEAYTAAGMYIKDGALKVHEDWTRAEFCSGVFWPAEGYDVYGGFVLGPKPGRVLSRFFYSRRVVPEPYIRGEARVRARALRDFASPVPVVHDLIQAVLRRPAETTRSQRSRCWEELRVQEASYMPYDPVVGIPHFAERYGLTSGQVCELIKQVQEAKGPCFLSGPVWQTIRRVDLGC
jgi:hypothetical protein